MTNYNSPSHILNSDVPLSADKNELLSTLEKLCHEARSLTCACPHCQKKAIKEYRPEIPHPTIYHCHSCNSNFLYLHNAPKPDSTDNLT